MKKAIVILSVIALFYSCEKGDIENETPQIEKETQTNQKNQADESCYTLEAKFDQDWYDYSVAFLKLRVTIYFGGFGPGLYLGEYTLNDEQIIRLEIPEFYRQYYQFSPTDRFKFEGQKVSSNGTPVFRDQLTVNQLGGQKTSFYLFNPNTSNTSYFNLPYAALDIQQCQ